MKIYVILYLEINNLFSIHHKTWRTRQEVWRERQIQGNLEAPTSLCSYVHSFVGLFDAKCESNLAQERQSRAPRRWRGRQIAEETDSFSNLSQACSAWDFFSEFRKMPRTERQKMFRIPRSSRFIVYENEKKPFDMCQMDKDMNKLIFTRVFVASKKPFVVRIVRVEKEVITQ